MFEKWGSLALVQGRGRGRPSRVGVEQILDTALSMGVDRLSMRSLAARMKIGVSTLYYHVASKEALLGLLGARILERFRLKLDDPSKWEDGIVATAKELRMVFELAPGLAQSAMVDPRWERAIVTLHEEGCSYLVRAGFTPAEAWLSARLLADFVEDYVVRTEAHRRAGCSDLEHASRMGGRTLRAAQRELAKNHHERRFEVGLDCIVRGIRARRLARSGGP